MIHVVALVVATPGKRKELLAAFNKIVPMVLEEPGCIDYHPFVDVDGADPAYGPDVFVVIETWENSSALGAHNTAPALTSFVTEAKDYLKSVEVHVLTAA